MRDKILRQVLIFLVKLLFGAHVRGREHFFTAGDKVLIIANHQSFLDPLLLAIFMPEKPAFAMNVFQADKWYFRWCAKVVKIYRLDPSQPMSMKALLTDLKKGAKVVFFPEGRITTTGGIMKIYDGAAMMVNKTGANILPIHIEGAQFSKLSRLGGIWPTRWFPRIRLQFFPPVITKNQPPIDSQYIYDLMTRNAFEAQPRGRLLIDALLEARSAYGKKKIIASDSSRKELSYQSLFTRSFVLAGVLKNYLSGQRYVAVMLPNALGAMATFTSLHMLGKIPCMLNFSSGENNILHACRIAGAKTVLTSRLFIEQGKFQSLAAALEKHYVVIYLEDIRTSIGTGDKIMGAIKGCFPRLFLASAKRKSTAHDPAVVLYTSGSEGVPKGVALSHTNILSNLSQSCARLDLQPSDRLFNALPVFHSFGLTIGMLLPMFRGIFVFLYPSPIHYRAIPELIYDTDATIMLGTDTFYRGYAHYAHSYDFHNIRLAVAGAEKLRDATRNLYADHFCVSIMQGYGVTEASPVLSCNTALYQRTGTVGRFFPAIEWRLEEVPGLAHGGRLWVKGPNVMLGYLKAEQPGVIQPQGEWYDTGDIVDVDKDGYITILGRAKRFAKIGGEMVSLAVSEELAASLRPDQAHAAITTLDERKGEQVILLSESPDMSRQLLMQAAKEAGIAEIFLPKQVLLVEAIPRLGNGKIDYPKLASLYQA